MLSNSPVKSYQTIGHYFLAVATHRVANGNTDIAKRLFETVAGSAPDTYKLKAMLALGSIAIRRKDFDSAMCYFQETARGDLNASLQAIRGIGVLKSFAGDHRHAIRDLESILPAMKYAPPHIYFDLLNSYAVELGEVGRKDEARSIMRFVLASPFIQAYPEWRETAEDLRPSRRSMVTVGAIPYNVLAMPEREPNQRRLPEPTPAQIFDLAKWKKQMAKSKKKNGKKPPEATSPPDMLYQIINLYTDSDITDEQRRRMFEAIMNIANEPSKPEPSDPDEPAS